MTEWKEEVEQVAENVEAVAECAVKGQIKEAAQGALITGAEVVADVVSGVLTGKPVNEEM